MQGELAFAPLSHLSRGGQETFIAPFQEEERGEEGDGRQQTGRKRGVGLAMFLACLSFLLIVANMISHLISQVIENEQVWQTLASMSRSQENTTNFLAKLWYNASSNTLSAPNASTHLTTTELSSVAHGEEEEEVT